MPTLGDKAREIGAKLAGFENFEDTIARLEQDARAFLGKENCPPTVGRNAQEPGTEAWVKFQFLIALRLIRGAIDRNEPTLVFQLSLELGALLERFDVIATYKLHINRGAKVVKGAAEGGKNKSTRDRDRLLATKFRERRAKALASVSDTSLKVAIGRESEFKLKREAAIKAVNRGLLLLSQETR